MVFQVDPILKYSAAEQVILQISTTWSLSLCRGFLWENIYCDDGDTSALTFRQKGRIFLLKNHFI
jgi:hypothetical protein